MPTKMPVSKEKKEPSGGGKPGKTRKKAAPARGAAEAGAAEAGAAGPVKKRRAAPRAKAARVGAPGRGNVTPTVEEISLRAYYIAEGRRAEGRWGDETGDWLEAERQLRAEACGGTDRPGARRGRHAKPGAD